MKTKYFAVADVHSYFNPLMRALIDNGFDINNPAHKLILCGDAFDRGDESQMLYNFLCALGKEDRLIYIRGNHEDLLDELLARKHPFSIDGHNGTYKTVIDLAPEATDFKNACEIVNKKIQPLREYMVNYYETKDYIFVHATVPVYEDNFRNSTNAEWKEARWENPFLEWINYEDKPIIHGHYHNRIYWNTFEEKESDEICAHGVMYDDRSIPGFIGLDTCTALSNKVNVFVYEEEE